MSSEIQEISTPDAILRIKKLIETNQGDPGRLQYISETLQKGKTLFHSDQIYLIKKISATVIPLKIIKTTEPNGKLKALKKLIAVNFGDPGRLRFILQTLQNNKKLYHSDENYLELKTKQFIQYTEGKKLKRRVRPTSIQKTDENVVLHSSEKIEELHASEPSQDFSDQLKEIEEAVVSPEEKPAELFDMLDDSPRINLDIKKEREKVSSLNHEHEQIKVQRDELNKLIAYRQDYELKINREKEVLENEIKIEQEKVREKDRLVEQLIKNQSELIKTKSEREVLIEQIKIDKIKSEEELKTKQKELEELKQEYEILQSEINSKKQNLDDQIKNQKEKNEKLKDDSEEI